jgi:hypothetical protein
MSPVITPKMIKCSISVCFVSGVASPSYKAIYEADSRQ